VSEENYYTLKALGKAGDSFNDVVNAMLKQKLQQAQSLATQGLDAEIKSPNRGESTGT
jgi:predicted CopG family antitoxin